MVMNLGRLKTCVGYVHEDLSAEQEREYDGDYEAGEYEVDE